MEGNKPVPTNSGNDPLTDVLNMFGKQNPESDSDGVSFESKDPQTLYQHILRLEEAVSTISNSTIDHTEKYNYGRYSDGEGDQDYYEYDDSVHPDSRIIKDAENLRNFYVEMDQICDSVRIPTDALITHFRDQALDGLRVDWQSIYRTLKPNRHAEKEFGFLAQRVIDQIMKAGEEEYDPFLGHDHPTMLLRTLALYYGTDIDINQNEMSSILHSTQSTISRNISGARQPLIENSMMNIMSENVLSKFTDIFAESDIRASLFPTKEIISKLDSGDRGQLAFALKEQKIDWIILYGENLLGLTFAKDLLSIAKPDAASDEDHKDQLTAILREVQWISNQYCVSALSQLMPNMNNWNIIHCLVDTTFSSKTGSNTDINHVNNLADIGSINTSCRFTDSKTITSNFLNLELNSPNFAIAAADRHSEFTNSLLEGLEQNDLTEIQNKLIELLTENDRLIQGYHSMVGIEEIIDFSLPKTVSHGQTGDENEKPS